MPSISSDALDQTLNTAPVLKYVLSKWTVKKDLVTGIDLGYLIGCSLFFHFILDISMWAFFFCGILWMTLPSNLLARTQYETFLQKYPILTKFFHFRPSPILKIKEGE